MIQSADPAVTAEKNKLANENAPIWLYELDVDDRNTVYLAANTEDLVVNGVTYQAFPIATSEIEDSSEANLTRVQLSISNITEEFGLILEEQNGFVGRRVRKLFVWSNQLDKPIQRFSLQIIEADVTDESVVFTVGLPSLLEESFPRGGYYPTCTFTHRGKGCFWPKPEDLPAGVVDITVCSHDLEGPNGCRAHGESWEAAGLTDSQWPGNFGGKIVPRRRQ